MVQLPLKFSALLASVLIVTDFAFWCSGSYWNFELPNFAGWQSLAMLLTLLTSIVAIITSLVSESRMSVIFLALLGTLTTAHNLFVAVEGRYLSIIYALVSLLSSMFLFKYSAALKSRIALRSRLVPFKLLFPRGPSSSSFSPV